jgi:Tol biopolymer transport system component
MRLRWAAPTALALTSFLLAGCGSTTPNATPQITGLFPSEITAGSQAFTLFVGGVQFLSTSTVQWNGSNRPTTFNAASTQLAASITAADVQTAGIASVTVTNPAPGGGVSLAISFTVDPAHNGGPTITSISPSSAALNGAAFTLMVTGTNFAPSDYVTWNGGLRATTFTSSTQLSAEILATDLTQQMTAGVAVHTSQLGVASPSVSFQVGSSASSAIMPELISVNALGGAADGLSSSPAVSADGRFVAFYSEAKNLVSTGVSGNIFVRDTCLGVADCTLHTIAADLAPDGSAPNALSLGLAMSADGRYVAFASRATNLVPDTLTGRSRIWRVFVRDLCRGNSAPANCWPQTELVSVNGDGEPVDGGQPTISADGRFIAFMASGRGLVSETSRAGSLVFVRDTCDGATASVTCSPRTVLVSEEGETPIWGNENAQPTISQNGRYVTFAGWPPETASSAPKRRGVSQIFLRDTCAGAQPTEACTASTARISVAPDAAPGNGESQSPSVSADGRFVVFESAASNLTFDSANREDVYLRDTCLGPTAPLGCSPTTARISTDADLRGQSLGNYSPSISPSGRYISYAAQTLRDPGWDSSGLGSLIVYDTCFGATTACSAGPVEVSAPDGSLVPLAFGNSKNAAVPLTPDGRFVVFFQPQAVITEPVNGLGDVFLTVTPFALTHR